METQSPPFKEPVRGNAEGEPREGGLCLSPCCRSPDVAWTSCFHQHPGDSRAGPICTGFLRLHWPERSRLSQGTVQGSLGKEGDIQAWLRVSGKIRAVWSPVQQVGATRSVQGNHQKSAAKTWLLYDAGMPVRFQRPHRAAQLTKLGLFLQNRKGIPWRGRRGRHSPGHWHSSPDRWTSFVGPSLDRSVLLPWGLLARGLSLPWGSACHGALPAMGLCLSWDSACQRCGFTKGPILAPSGRGWRQVPAGGWLHVPKTFSSAHALRDSLMDTGKGISHSAGGPASSDAGSGGLRGLPSFLPPAPLRSHLKAGLAGCPSMAAASPLPTARSSRSIFRSQEVRVLETPQCRDSCTTQ